MARAKRKQASKHENWADRDGQARPTPERRRKGLFRLVDAENAGERYSIDTAASMAGLYYAVGLLDETQLDAAARFEAIARSQRGSPSQKSCLDFSPVGYDADDDTEQEEAAQREWRNLLTMLSAETRDVLSDVCWEYKDALGLIKEVKKKDQEGRVMINTAVSPRNHNILCLGLDITAVFYKI